MAKGPIRSTPDCPGARHTEFWPKQINLFHDCPECYYRSYIGHEVPPPRFSRGLLRGSATHKALWEVFNARLDGVLLDATHRQLAERFLPLHRYLRYASEADWRADVDEVTALIDSGVAAIPSNAAIVEVERVVRFVMPRSSPIRGVTLKGRVDLVIRLPDAIEHIEFKTGTAGVDLMQEVICRIGVCDAYNQQGLPINSTVIQLSTGEEYSFAGDLELKRSTLGKIERTILDIWSATSWPARECARCAFCDYADTLCSLRGEWSRRSRHELE